MSGPLAASGGRSDELNLCGNPYIPYIPNNDSNDNNPNNPAVLNGQHPRLSSLPNIPRCPAVVTA
jgi:hypothetical protein